MNKVIAFKYSLIFAIIFSLLGSYFKISHYPYGDILSGLGLLVSLVFIVLGLLDVFLKSNYKTIEKIMWTVGLILLSWIAGLLYYPKFKKRNQQKGNA